MAPLSSKPAELLPPGPRASLAAAREPADVLPMEQNHGRGRCPAEGDHRPRLSEQPGKQRERAGRHDRGNRGVAGDEEDEDPDACPDRPDDGGDAEYRATGGCDGLAALLEPEEDRPRVPDHGRASREHPGQRSGHLGGDECGHKALRDVEEHDGNAVPPAERTPHVRRADVPAADGADVDVLRRAHEPVPEGHGPDEVGRGDEERRRHRLRRLRPDAVRVDPVVDNRPVEVVEERFDVRAAIGLVVEEVRVLVDVEGDER